MYYRNSYLVQQYGLSAYILTNGLSKAHFRYRNEQEKGRGWPPPSSDALGGGNEKLCNRKTSLQPHAHTTELTAVRPPCEEVMSSTVILGLPSVHQNLGVDFICTSTIIRKKGEDRPSWLQALPHSDLCNVSSGSSPPPLAPAEPFGELLSPCSLPVLRHKLQ